MVVGMNNTLDDLSDTNLYDESTTADRGVEPRRNYVSRCTAGHELISYWLPLLSGLFVSLMKPVYSMVTVSPTLAVAPLPSERTFFVTPIAAVVADKFRVI